MAKLKKALPKPRSRASPPISPPPRAATGSRRRAPADILINNAGIFKPKEFVSIPHEAWMRMFEVNVLTGVQLTRPTCPA